MFLIVGLGNVGKEYDNTYHNVGFMVADEIAKRLDLSFSKTKCNALVAEGRYNGQKIIIAKPKTYMNLSGNAVLPLMQQFKIEKQNVVIALDDIDLKKGAFRVRECGSAGTHNGLRHIVSLLGQDVPRVRVGIDRGQGDLADYVLSKIDNESLNLILPAVEQAASAILGRIHD